MDTETTGLQIAGRDRLCVVQISDGNGDAHIVQLAPEEYAKADHIKSVLSDPKRTLIFHYARFDMVALKRYLDIDLPSVYCTKIASRLVRTYTDKHGLKDLCREFLGVELSKQQQSSDWASANISKEQLHYAASDVLHLHALKTTLDSMLLRENRMDLFTQCCNFLPTRVALDLAGWHETNIFSHA